MKYIRLLPLTLALAAALLITQGSLAQGPPSLSIGTPVAIAPGGNGLAASRFQANTAVLDREESNLQIKLPDGPTIVLQRKESARRAAGNVAWHGGVQNGNGSHVTLTLKNGLVAGTIRHGNDVYELRPTADGATVIEKLNQSSFPSCGGTKVPARPANQPRPQTFDDLNANQYLTTTAQVDIHVMSVYTPQARTTAGGTAQMQTLIQAAVDTANSAFTNSQINARYVLVHTAEVSYNDSGSLSTDLNWVSANSTVAALRDQYGADLVSLVVENGGGSCGLGYVMSYPDPFLGDYAFQVTARNCAVGNLSYAHENGHNLGMEHDPANGSAPESASYPWSFGHYVNGVFRTVMSYSNTTMCPSGCTRVAYFSNPNVSYLGYATGIADQRDNARTANLTAPFAADFRASVVTSNPPAAPGSLTAAAVSTSQINLAWADNAGDETGFKVESSLNNSTWTQIATVGANVTSYNHTGLSPATTYYYRVRAYNGVGDSAYSNTANATTQTPPPYTDQTATGDLPVSGTVTGTYQSTLTNNAAVETIQELLSGGKATSRYSYLEHKWTFTVGAGYGVTFFANVWATTGDGDTFRFDYSTNNSTWTAMFAVSATADGGYQSFALPTATAGSVYVRLIDTNRNAGNSVADTVRVDHLFIRTDNLPPTPPNAPSNLAAAAFSSSQVNLTWTDNANNETGFQLERSPNGTSGWTQIATPGPSATSFSDTGLTAGTAYYYRLRAANSAGASAYSGTATATTLPPTPMHVGDLDRTTTTGKAGKWNANVIITVHNVGEALLTGVTVTGTWSGGTTGTGSCITDGSGKCTVNKSNLAGTATAVTFTVNSLSLSAYAYNAAANHEPDVPADSTGTAITVNKP